MCCNLGVRILGKLFVAALLAGIWLPGSHAVASTETVEVYSDIVALDVGVQPQVGELVPSDFVQQLSREEPQPVNDGLKIAEPGTLGLMALAGLMGGAIAMRRRLG